MLVRSNLRPLRMSRGIPRHVLAAITAIDPQRLADIELRKVEPWLDEATTIAAILNASAHDLLSPKDLVDFDLDPRFFASDIKFWQDGYRLPLSIALRLQHRYGLPSVEHLHPSPFMRQLWDIMEASERHPSAPGWCPWCQAHRAAGEPHTGDCLPHNLLGVRTPRAFDDVNGPQPARGGRRSGSARVHGLRALRERLGLTQADMASHLDYNANHYARIERSELPLPLTKADVLAKLFGVTRDEIYGDAGDAP